MARIPDPPEHLERLKNNLTTFIKKVIEPQYVPNGSDLNDYTNVGMYYNGGNVDVTNITNLPNNDHTAFCLFVEEMGGNAKKQTWTKQSDINSMFVRVKKWDNTWTSWKPVWEDTGWKDMTFPTGFTHYTTTEQRAKYRRIGKVVYVRGAVKNTNAFTPNTDNGTTICTIGDTSCRPQYFWNFVQQGSGMNRFSLRVNSDGKINIYRYGTTSASQVGASSWLNIHCSFVVE